MIAIATVPCAEDADKRIARVFSAAIGGLTQIAAIVLFIIGFWHWDQPFWQTMLDLMAFGIIANATRSADSKGMPAVVQIIGVILAVGFCVFSYIKLI